ncbi:hypothetical protein BDV95DRAFT_584696 [Massariosphaeria phaeospora]|uniref:F-box domain-containing protein n=1 Tax=Massariosphaeria phaeospora TaxID=100035 RepID=A0A7C8M5M4_9PLEO|nr:hypothetical protein BDV95DRAFT_584696 [Massariosphaeria phaeospora]
MSKAQSHFLGLPLELRNQILGYAVDIGSAGKLTAAEESLFDEPERTAINLADNHNITEYPVTPPFAALPAICKASRQLYWEATPILIQSTTLSSPDAATSLWLTRWLSTFPSNQGFLANRRLKFANFHDDAIARAYELIALCPNLRALHITLSKAKTDPRMLARLEGDPGTEPNWEAVLEDEVQREFELYRFVSLKDIPRLQKFSFGFHEWKDIVWYIVMYQQGLEVLQRRIVYMRTPFRLCELVEAHLQEAGREVLVQCVDTRVGDAPDSESDIGYGTFD